MQVGRAVSDKGNTNLTALSTSLDYFAGGSNRPHWVAADAAGEPWFVECQGWGGDYEASGPPDPETDQPRCEQFENAYDAFWWADVQRGLRADAAGGTIRV